MHEHNFPVAGIQYVIDKKGWIEVPASGVSMYPLIQAGDICRFIPLNPDQIAKGDIILFLSNDGRLVGHRYHRSFIKERTLHHTFKGDTNFQYDSPVFTSQLIGRLVRINKRAWYLDPDGLLAKSWGRLIFAFPPLPRFCKRWLSWKNRFSASSKEHRHASN